MNNRLCLLLVFGFLLVTGSYAQSDLFLNFNSTHSGRNLSFSYSKYFFEKNEFGFGLRYNINRIAHPDDQNNTYKKRLYATKPYHFLGAEVLYNRYILKSFSFIDPFVFYNLQLSYSTTRNRMFIPYTYDGNGDVLYKEYIEIFGPFTWVEQNIGLGYKANLNGNWFIQHKLGFGTSFILGYEKKLLNKYFNWFAWEFGYIINVGIGYKFE